MKTLISNTTLLNVMGLIILLGCDQSNQARIDVAKKKFLNGVDNVLGKMDVQKKDIENGIQAAKQSLNQIRKAKIKAQSDLDLLEEKIRPPQEKIAKYDETLAKYRDLIKADKPAVLNGKTYSTDELREMAGKVIEARKEIAGHIKGLDPSRDGLKNLVADLSKKQKDLENRIAKFQAATSKLESEMEATKAMKDASTAIGNDNGNSFQVNLDLLEKKISNLSAEVHVELTSESENLSAGGSDKASNDVDKFIKAVQKPIDTLDEIDRILGTGKK